MPTGIDRPALLAAIARYDAAMIPASVQARAVIIDPLLAFARAHNVPTDATALIQGYMDGLSDLPVDLLQQAVTATLATWRSTFAMPTPAVIREHVAGELARRRRERGRVEIALRRLPRPASAGVRPIDQLAAQMRLATIDADTPRLPVMDRRRDDGQEPTPLVESIRRGRAGLTGLSLDQRVERAQGGRGHVPA